MDDGYPKSGCGQRWSCYVEGMKPNHAQDESLVSPPASSQRRALAKRGHLLKARLAVGRAGITEAFLNQVRQALEKADLLKVRMDADDAAGSDAMAADLARQVPCHLIQRVGHVALLYRPLPENTAPLAYEGTDRIEYRGEMRGETYGHR